MEIGNPSKLPFRFRVLHLPPPKKTWETFTPWKKHVSNDKGVIHPHQWLHLPTQVVVRLRWVLLGELPPASSPGGRTNPTKGATDMTDMTGIWWCLVCEQGLCSPLCSDFPLRKRNRKFSNQKTMVPICSLTLAGSERIRLWIPRKRGGCVLFATCCCWFPNGTEKGETSLFCEDMSFPLHLLILLNEMLVGIFSSMETGYSIPV